MNENLIISYSIECALKSNLFDEVMVSTDDNEIATIAVKHGAKVPFIRSKKNSNDFARTYHVIVEVVETCKRICKEFEVACCICPTAPLIKPHRLKEGLELLTKGNYISVFPIVDFGYPILRSLNSILTIKWP